MSSFWTYLLAVILILVWVTAGVFITDANIKLTTASNVDNFLHQAYWNTFWAAFITWTLIGVTILITILVVIFLGEFILVAYESSDDSGSGTSWFVIVFIFIALILVSITGILSALAASEVAKSPNTVHTDPTYIEIYRDCVISAVACLSAVGILIIAVIAYFIVAANRRARIAKYNEIKDKIAADEHMKVQQVKDLELQVLKAEVQNKLLEQQALIAKVNQ